jgi:hypothetical protein
VEILKGKEPLRYLGVGERIILKHFVGKWGVRAPNDSACSGYGLIAQFYEKSDEPSVSLNTGSF